MAETKMLPCPLCDQTGETFERREAVSEECRFCGGEGFVPVLDLDEFDANVKGQLSEHLEGHP